MLALAQYTDEIRCHVPLNDPPCAHKKSAKKRLDFFLPEVVLGLVNSVREFAVIILPCSVHALIFNSVHC